MIAEKLDEKEGGGKTYAYGQIPYTKYRKHIAISKSYAENQQKPIALKDSVGA